MERLKSSLYEVLGVSRDAKLQDITRAYNRYRAEMRDETVAPDARRDALMREAHEVLTDPQRREAYDASLRRGLVARIPEKKKRPVALALAAVTLACAGIAGGLFATRKPPGPPPKSPDEVLATATLALGRLQLVDMSGSAKTLGVTVAVEEGVALTSCNGIVPGAALSVLAPTRAAPARVAQSDPQGRCRLAVSGGAGFPLRINPTQPRTAETVYVPIVSPKGEVALRTSKILRVEPGETRTFLTELAAADIPAGSAMLDRDGRLLGVAWNEGDGRFTSLPQSWVDSADPLPKKAAPAPEPEAPPKGAPAAPSAADRVSPERRERIEKAYAPAHKVPDDL